MLTFSLPPRCGHSLLAPSCLCLALGLVACKEQPVITSQIVAKIPDFESKATVPSSQSAPGPQGTSAIAELGFQTPDGWIKLPAEGRNAASFMAGSGEKAPAVNVTPMTSFQGRELELVGLWRAALSLPELPEAETAAALQVVKIGAADGQLFEVIAPDKQDVPGSKIVTAFLHREGETWFFKLQGSQAEVDAQRANFEAFLSSIQFK